jgi:hypothetical protein
VRAADPHSRLIFRPLIAAMARANATWGEERIAAELRLKLGLSVSPGTVRRYIGRSGRPHNRRSSQQWSTFVRNHAGAMLACDFFVTFTATFRTRYVLVVLEVGTRRIVHWNVTEHPTAEWTSSSSAQLFRRSSATLPHSRSRQHQFGGRGWRGRRDGPDGAENAGAVPASERVLRVTDRYTPSRVLDRLILLNERHSIRSPGVGG